MSSTILRHPSTPTRWDRDTAAKIAERVPPRAADGEEAAQLIILLLRAKIDGPVHKLASLAGTDPATTTDLLRTAYTRLESDPTFNRLFHRLRSAL